MKTRAEVTLNKPFYEVQYNPSGVLTYSGYSVVRMQYQLGVLGFIRRKRETVFFERTPLYCLSLDEHTRAREKCDAVLKVLAERDK